MKKANPIIIPRNHQIERVIHEVRSGNIVAFTRAWEAFFDPYSERENFTEFEHAPTAEEEVFETFCGT